MRRIRGGRRLRFAGAGCAVRVWFKPARGGRVTARVPYDGCDHVVVPGACSRCGNMVPDKREHRVAGVPGTMRRGHDTYTAEAVCCACGATTGSLVLKVSTIFGIEEDERVCNGRARVY